MNGLTDSHIFSQYSGISSHSFGCLYLPDASLPVDDKGAGLADSRDDTIDTPVVPEDDTANARLSYTSSQEWDWQLTLQRICPKDSILAARNGVSAQECTRRKPGLLRMTKEEQMMATMSITDLLKGTIDDAVHRNDPEMTTTSKDKIKVCAYLIT